MSGNTLRILKLITFFLLITGAFSLSYYQFINPAKQEIEETVKQLQFEDQVLSALQQKVMEQEEASKLDTLELQNKIPTNPNIDGLVMDLREVEKATKSRIYNLVFNEQEAEDPSIMTEQAGASVQEENPAEAEAQDQLPALTKITATITLKSPNFQELRQFIIGLEKLERTIKVDSITFGEEAKDIIYTVMISAIMHLNFMGRLRNVQGTLFHLLA
ncbi:hypothetical protein [Caldalkalibacillus mannanilyticus]|uniref:hypothetical protein n=1 Tax=Caldalkalibacillus mannanilyticus TaxID=1418 RepID=UPI00046A55E8|nr:hypothetical protein [Caldalkalibacillus mannanilyticus]